MILITMEVGKNSRNMTNHISTMGMEMGIMVIISINLIKNVWDLSVI